MLDELWLIVANQLDPKDIVSFSQTCRKFRLLTAECKCWEDTRQRLSFPPVRARAWKRTTAFSIVMARSCARCRARRRASRLPFCTKCSPPHMQQCSRRIDRFQVATKYWEFRWRCSFMFEHRVAAHYNFIRARDNKRLEEYTLQNMLTAWKS